MTHEFPVTVYYEDTDLAGIVYYANYLKFIERARSTLVADAGIDQLELQNQGVVFAVRHVDANYLAPAKLMDKLTIATKLQHMGRTKIEFSQDVSRGDKMLFSSTITVVCVSDAGRPVRIPADIRDKLQKFSAKSGA